VHASEALRDKDFNVSANEFVPRVAEQFFDVCVHQHDPAVIIDKDSAAGRGLRRQAKKFLRLLSLRDVHRYTEKPWRLAIFFQKIASTSAYPADRSIRQ